MKFSIAVISAALFMAVPAFAQTPAQPAQSKPPVHHQSVASTPAAQPGADAVPPAPAAEKVDPAKDAAIRHLINVTQSDKLGDSIRGAISNQVENVMSRAIQPDQLQKFMDTFNQKFESSAPTSAVTDSMVPIYAHHFSLEDIQEITRFYETPVGQRLVKEMPGVVQETHFKGVEMDQKAAIDTLRSMSDDYPQLKQMLPPDETKPAGPAAPATGAAPGPAPAPAPAPSAAPSPSPAPSPTPPPQK